MNPRTDIFVTTAQEALAPAIAHAQDIAIELGAPYVARGRCGLDKLFPQFPDAQTAFVVKRDALTLVHRDGIELFYHPSIAFLRLANLLRGQRDLLLDALQLREGERVLDATLGYAAEAILCAHALGKTAIVHGIEAVPELGILIREGLRTVETNTPLLNAAMRRVQLVHIGTHLEYLRRCETGSYDVVCFDPFFEQHLASSQAMEPLRQFGDRSPLTLEAVTEAQRVAKRLVCIKAARSQDNLDRFGAVRRVESRSGKVVYGLLEKASD